MPRPPIGRRPLVTAPTRDLSRLDAATRALLERGAVGLDCPEAQRGDVFEALVLEGDEQQLRAVWAEWREPLVREWIAQHPGTRPWAWWHFDAPQPERRRIGGRGVEMTEKHLAYLRRREFGVPVDWHEIDPDDPPRYESQAAYLRRHGLLAPEERRRLTSHDFDPEVILFDKEHNT